MLNLSIKSLNCFTTTDKSIFPVITAKAANPAATAVIAGARSKSNGSNAGAKNFAVNTVAKIAPSPNAAFLTVSNVIPKLESLSLKSVNLVLIPSIVEPTFAKDS